MNSVNELHQVPNINHVLQNFIYFVSTYKREQTPPKKSRPLDSYHRYNRNINQRLKEINMNLSNALSESCSEIDNICNRVRMCLNDMKYQNTTEEKFSSELQVSIADVEEEATSISVVKSKPVVSARSVDSAPKNKAENNEVTLIPDFTTFVQPEKVLSVKRNKKIIREFRNLVLSKKYDEKCINTMVEEINRNIETFSKTAINETKVINEPKKHEKCEKPLLSNEPLLPDVYRKPGTTDLYEKLLFQIETNDSFICFQKLMNKKLKLPRHTRNSNIKTKYKDSFFFPHKNFSRKKEHRKKITSSQGSLHNSLKGDFKSELTFSVKKRKVVSNNRKSSMSCSLGQFSLKVHNEIPSLTETQRNNWLRVKTQQAPHRKLRCWDILDNLTERDLIPLKSEYPRREKPPSSNFTDYLQILNEEGVEDAWMKLLQPKVECEEQANVESKPQDNTNVMSKREIIHKLQPIIFGTDQLQATEITVLPIQVVYDSKPKNYDRGLPKLSKHAFNQKCSIITMKEETSSDKARWSSVGSSRNADSRPIREVKINKKIVLQPALPAPKPGNVPRSKNVIQKKVIKPPPLPVMRSPSRNIESEIENKFQNVPTKEKKLWAYKYHKGPGCQLINFIENQKKLPVAELPKHALPKSPIPQTRSGKTHQKKVLSHLKDLKQKNYAIQSNIENAINVIEKKLADILSSPDSHDSSEAFNHMEKEITNVLSMIKCNADSKEKLHDIKETTAIEEDFDSISKELFKKLEKILDSDSRTPESISSYGSTRSKGRKKVNKITQPAEKPIDSPKKTSQMDDPERDENCVLAKKVDENCHGDFTRIEALAGETCASRNPTPEPPLCMKEGTPSDKPAEDESSVNDDSVNESVEMPEVDKDATQHQEPVSNTPTKFIEETPDEQNLPQHINKIIRRVEDIYKELDEIQIAECPNISVFQEKLDLFDVSSEEFLTPFMQAIKDKRKNPPAQSMNDTNRSPSYYNVLNFLESLNDIQEEEHVVEIHTAIMCHFPLMCEEAKVFYQAYLEQPLKYLDPERPSCLKRSNSDCKSKGKKVTFNIMKEDKDIQADIDYSLQEQSVDDVENEQNDLNKEINVSQDCFFEEDPPVDKGGTENDQNDTTELQLEDKTDSNVEELSQSQYFLETNPEIKVFYDEQNDIPRVVIKHKVCTGDSNKNMIKKEDQEAKPNIVVFREISEVSDLLTPLKNLENLKNSTRDFHNIQIIKKVKKMHQRALPALPPHVVDDESKKLFLKSIYAMVYIVMFTALNLDFMCL